MPSSRPPQLRRPVIVVVSAVLGVLALLGGPTSLAHAYPYASDTGPTLTLPAEATFVLGQTGTSYLIEADGDPVPAIGVDKLPAGLRLTPHGDGSATIEGTATGPVGDLAVEVTAQNASGASYERLTVTVQQAPAFGSRGPVVFVAGEQTTRVIRTVGFPAAGIGLEGELPAGLTFTDNGDGTASIAGTAGRRTDVVAGDPDGGQRGLGRLAHHGRAGRRQLQMPRAHRSPWCGPPGLVAPPETQLRHQPGSSRPPGPRLNGEARIRAPAASAAADDPA